MTNWSQLLNNPFFGGSALLMVGGAAMALLRKVPGELYAWLKSQIMVTVDVTNSDPCFDWVTSWLHELPYSRRTRRVTASTRAVHWWNQDDEDRTLPKIVLSPAPGEHLIRWKNRWLWLNRERKENSGAVGLGTLRMETYTITIFGRRQETAKELLADIRAGAEKLRERGESVYCNGHGEWRKLENYLPRSLESVVLPEGMAENVLADMREFLGGRKWYEDKGIPYRRGYLFEGIPGTGKSSLIAALSHELRLNLYTVNIASKDLSDGALAELMNSVPSGSILLFEDIDAATAKRAKRGKKAKDEENKHISLSGLLNCLDGLLANTGVMVFMTTNRPQTLDEALVRPGRVDLRLRFGYAEPGQVEKLAKRFYPGFDCKRFSTALSKKRITMAEAQMAMMAHKVDPLLALEELSAK